MIHDDIPFKKIWNVHFFVEYICILYTNAIMTSKFPPFLKMTNVSPIFKKGS